MSEHTPAPWNADGNRIDSAAYFVAEVQAPSLATRNADARLIAAAPELLAAAEDHAMRCCCCCADVHDLKAAIAKARGE